jgi:microcin C transport system permease protein
MNRRLSIIAIVVGLLAILGELMGLDLPSISWFFRMGPTFGWVSSLLLIAMGIAGLALLPSQIRWNPVTLRRFGRFRALRRGWWALMILGGLISLALLDQSLVGRRALLVSHKGKLHCPAFVKHRYQAHDFGQSADGEVDYRQLQRDFAQAGRGWVIMPLVPWEPVLDTDSGQQVTLELRDGLYYHPIDSQPFSGRAARYYADDPKAKHSEIRYRKGLPDGEWLGYSRNRALAVSASYKAGKVERERWTGEEPQDSFRAAATTEPKLTLYPPIPPLWKTRHYLGTDSRGWDVLAQIYGGWQLNLKAILLYLSITYGVGVTLGSLMGLVGGVFDLIMQRVIEILEELPFLFIVMIVVSLVSVADMNLGILMGVICLFSWTSLTYTMRALAYKEKERDYISAARLQGASNWRILTRYLLPNMLSTLVTQIPFSVAGIVTSLTSLAFLGFGLPETYAQWGWLFDDGIHHLTALWISISMFIVMVTILLLVTFVGEALREAFDPKKFSTYQ